MEDEGDIEKRVIEGLHAWYTSYFGQTRELDGEEVTFPSVDLKYQTDDGVPDEKPMLHTVLTEMTWNVIEESGGRFVEGGVVLAVYVRAREIARKRSEFAVRRVADLVRRLYQSPGAREGLSRIGLLRMRVRRGPTPIEGGGSLCRFMLVSGRVYLKVTG